MAIALDKTMSLFNASNPATRFIAFSFPSTPVVGSLIVVPILLWVNDTGPTNYFESVTDNQGNGTYGNLQQASATGLQAQCHLAYVKATNASGTFTMTLALTSAVVLSNVFMWIGAASFTGLTGALDQSQKGTVAAASTQLTLTTGVVSQASGLVVACANIAANDTNLNIAQNAGGYTNLYLVNDGVTVTGARVDYFEHTSISTKFTDWGFDPASGAGIIATFPASGASPTIAGSAATGGHGLQAPGIQVPL